MSECSAKVQFRFVKVRLMDFPYRCVQDQFNSSAPRSYIEFYVHKVTKNPTDDEAFGTSPYRQRHLSSGAAWPGCVAFGVVKLPITDVAVIPCHCLAVQDEADDDQVNYMVSKAHYSNHTLAHTHTHKHTTPTPRRLFYFRVLNEATSSTNLARTRGWGTLSCGTGTQSSLASHCRRVWKAEKQA